MTSRKTITVAALAIAFGLSCISAFATGPTTLSDVLKVDEFDFANTTGFPDAALYLINDGSNATNMCANIYVFNNAEEMEACGSCPVSYKIGTTEGNGSRKLSVNVDLTSNGLTKQVITTGTIFIVSTAGNSSDTCPDANQASLTHAVPGIRALGTHVDGTGTVSKSEAQDAPLSTTGSPSEAALLVGLCNDIRLVGSGVGTITCGTGM